MKITRSTKIKQQIKLANNVKAELIRIINGRLNDSRDTGDQVDEWKNLLSEVQSVSEGFSVSQKTIPYDQVDRCSSMLTGPFYVSKDFPVPLGKNAPLFPLVQLDLSIIAKALGDECGVGLLQIWFDVDSEKEFIRTISLDQIKNFEPIEFNVEALEQESSFPLPFWVEKNPVKNGVSVLQGLVSYGVQLEENLSHKYDLFEKSDDWLATLLTIFGQITSRTVSKNFSVGGNLFSIQYNQSDVQMRQLMQLSDWGSSGSAEIFFRSNKEAPAEFAFWSCVR